MADFLIQAMDKSARHQQEALWELLYTELNYISKLTVITDVSHF